MLLDSSNSNQNTEAVDLILNPLVTSESDKTVLVNIQAVPPKDGKRKPCTFICVLDVSGSMGEDATVQQGGEKHGFSRLDLVKHSVKSIIHLLEPQDHLAIVSFSDTAKIEFHLTSMNETGRKRAITQLEQLQPTNSTNVWDGIRVGLDLTKEAECKNRNTAVVLLTDGEPNINPPRGIVPTLQTYIKNNPLQCTLHTFGFGYNLDSGLLNEIAMEGNGTYAYIPDCSMVGTIFVNFMSHILSLCANKASIVLEPLQGTKVLQVLGLPNDLQLEENQELSLGSIQFGQKRDLVVKVKVQGELDQPYLKVHLHYDSGSLQQVTKVLENVTPLDTKELQVQTERLAYIYDLTRIMKEAIRSQSMTGATPALKKLITKLKTSPVKDDVRIKALLRELESTNENEAQAFKSFEKKEFFDKWGKHYIPSLLRAHWLQYCNNFKDPGVQLYGGKLFSNLRDVADDMFCKLPPPKPSKKYSNDTNVKQVSNMKYYYNVGGGCFDGNSLVSLANGTAKAVKELIKGDEIQTLNNKTAKVVCVVKTSIASQKLEMVELNGLLITPWHPVRLENEWKFPSALKSSQLYTIDCVYNLVLDCEHVAIINGVECICLGHGMTDNEVVKHEYLGTEKVIQDLQKQPGWENGCVELVNNSMVRDETSGLVIGMQTLVHVSV